MTLCTSNVRSYMLMEVGNAVQAWYQLRNLPPPVQQQQAGTADDFNGGGSGGSASSALQHFWIDYWLQCIPLPGSTEVWRWGRVWPIPTQHYRLAMLQPRAAHFKIANLYFQFFKTPHTLKQGRWCLSHLLPLLTTTLVSCLSPQDFFAHLPTMIATHVCSSPILPTKSGRFVSPLREKLRVCHDPTLASLLDEPELQVG